MNIRKNQSVDIFLFHQALLSNVTGHSETFLKSSAFQRTSWQGLHIVKEVFPVSSCFDFIYTLNVAIKLSRAPERLQRSHSFQSSVLDCAFFYRLLTVA